MITKIVISGITFLITLATGIWLSKTGKPYHSGIFNLHKLIAIGMVVYAVIFIRSILSGVEPGSLLKLFLYIAGFLVVYAVVSGGLLHAEKGSYELMLWIHRISSILLIIDTVAIFYLLMKI